MAPAEHVGDVPGPLADSPCPRQYHRCAASRSPLAQYASPRSAAAAPRPRWSSSPTRSSARRAWVTVPATSPRSQGLPGTVHGDRPPAERRNSSSSTTTISGGRARIRRVTGRRVQPPLGVPQAGLDALELAAHQQRPAYPTLSTGRTRTSSSGSASSQPTQRGLLPAPGAVAGTAELDQVRRSLEVLGGQRVADRLGRLAVLLVPRARPPVQVRHLVGLLVQQARLQHVGEEVVVAIPLAAVVERDQEQVAALQRLQHGLAAVLAGDGIAQRAAQPVQDGGLQQEVPDLVGLALQHLLDQVVDDVAVVAGEAGDEAGDVVAPLHRQRRQLERGDPPLGAPLQRGDVLLPSASSPITSLRYAAASSGVKRRSAARISTSSPRARSRASGSAGSARLAITRCSCGGRWSSRKAIPSWTSRASMTW